jgi:quercetin dioxygenase-like cupin family protein
MKPIEVEHWSQEKDGSVSEEGMRRKLEQLGYRVTRYVYAPGTTFPSHTHSVDKIDAVLSGQFRISMTGDAVVLMPGDFIRVPAGVEHSAEVVGRQAVVSLDGVSASK